MAVKKGQPIELVVSDMAYGGNGVAKINGFTVFVEQAAPGDRVVARILKKKKSFATARILEILAPSPFRIEPPCPYSGVCGGCTWQFLDYHRQLLYKRQHVIDSLERIGQLRDVEVHPVVPSPLLFGYRNKMEFSCSDRRWLLPGESDRQGLDADFAMGLHVPGVFSKVLDIEACLLQSGLGNRLLQEVRVHIRHSGLPVYGLKSHEGFWRFLVLRHSVFDDRWMVNIVTAAENPDVLRPLAERLMDKYPKVVSVINAVTSRRAAVATGEYETLISGSSVLKERIGPFEFEISAGSFFQTNTTGAEKLYETVKQYAGLSGSETVVDLYSGAGTIAIFLSRAAARVIGIEIVDSAVSDARRNCLLNDVSNCRFICGDIRESLAQISECPDVLIIDPPRAGIHPDVVRQVLRMAPPRIVFVSCNPATLARDLQMMAEQYRICEVQPVDMFPQTYHIEAVARLDHK